MLRGWGTRRSSEDETSLEKQWFGVVIERGCGGDGGLRGFGGTSFLDVLKWVWQERGEASEGKEKGREEKGVLHGCGLRL